MDARRHNCAASPNSTLEDRVFTFSASFESGTTWEYSVDGPVVYKDVGGVNAWVVADNQVPFDPRTEMYVRIHIPVSV